MKLFGWLNLMKRNSEDDTSLQRAFSEVSAQSKITQARIDTIVQLEKTRLRNLELRAEVLSRTRLTNG